MMVLVWRHQIEVDLLTCATRYSPEGFNFVTERKALSWRFSHLGAVFLLKS